MSLNFIHTTTIKIIVDHNLIGFHLATKIWDGSEINEWAYSAHQVPWDVFLGELIFFRLFWVSFDQKQMLVV